MQLARGITRRRELALRTALGATRARIVKHLLTEAVLLALAGLAVGVALTLWGAAALRAAIPPSVGSYIVEPQLSWRVFVFALIATIACIVLVGLVPAIHVSRVDPNEMLKSGAGTGATRKHRRQYGYLVAVEIALALALLTGASLMVRSTLRLSLNTFAYDPTPLIGGVMDAGLRPTGIERRPASEVFQAAAARALLVPGVEAAAAFTFGSLRGVSVTVSDSARGVREFPQPGFGYRRVGPSYLKTVGLPIVKGRDFREGERDEPVVIIDEYTAAGLWPGGNPIGAMIKFGDANSNAPFVRIVGVAGRETQRRGGLPSTTEMRLGTVYYLPGPADSLTFRPAGPWAVSFVARAPKNTSAVATALRQSGAKNVKPLGDDFRRMREGSAFISSMFSLFAALGLGLAAFGVYGVVAHSVAERRRELGVRIALGATSRDILHAVLRESVLIGLVGIALGLLATKYGSKLLIQFAEDDIYNAGLFAFAAAFLFAVAALSAFAPALRATKVDPTESLRCE
jgi:putative ABC transport system permease protein